MSQAASLPLPTQPEPSPAVCSACGTPLRPGAIRCLPCLLAGEHAATNALLAREAADRAALDAEMATCPACLSGSARPVPHGGCRCRVPVAHCSSCFSDGGW